MGEKPSASPAKNSFKFLCNFGGRILPYAPNGNLKYVGGETHVVSVPRSISFSDLQNKIVGICGIPDVTIKYQLYAEDLDSLVSITCDEDIKHMVDECDRLKAMKTSLTSFRRSPPRLKVYLIPNYSDQIYSSGDHNDMNKHANSLEQDYINAINSTQSTSSSIVSRTHSSLFSINPSPLSVSTSNPTSNNVESDNPMDFSMLVSIRIQDMNKAHSSPNLRAIGNQQASTRNRHPEINQKLHRSQSRLCNASTDSHRSNTLLIQDNVGNRDIDPMDRLHETGQFSRFVSNDGWDERLGSQPHNTSGYSNQYLMRYYKPFSIPRLGSNICSTNFSFSPGNDMRPCKKW